MASRKNIISLYPKTTVKRSLPVNIKPTDESYFKNATSYEMHESTLLRLKDIYVLYDSLFNFRRLSFYQSFTHWYKISLKAKIFRLSLLFKKREKMVKALWVINNWSEGYFHWFTDTMPRIFVSEKFIELHPLILPEKYKQYPYISDSIKMLGIPFIYYNQRRAVKIADLLLPSHTAPTGNYNETVINQVRQRFLVNYKNNTPQRKIYISRKKANTRRIINEEEVISLLLNYNFEIHNFEDYPFERQMQLMSETKYLVGVHGGGLTNMLFMKEKGKILELRNEGDALNNCYFSLSAALSHDYYYQLNKGTSKITQFADVEINLDELKNNIELMIRDRD